MLIGASRHKIWPDFLLEYKEDEERQANFSTSEASQSILKMAASFADGAILMEI